MKDLRAVRPSWDVGLIVLCRSCDGYSKAIRRELKDALAEAGLRRRVRVVESSCLDICPKGATAAVALRPTGREVVVVAADAGAPALRELVRRFESAEPSIERAR